MNKTQTPPALAVAFWIVLIVAVVILIATAPIVEAW